MPDWLVYYIIGGLGFAILAVVILAGLGTRSATKVASREWRVIEALVKEGCDFWIGPHIAFPGYRAVFFRMSDCDECNKIEIPWEYCAHAITPLAALYRAAEKHYERRTT